MFFSTDQSTNCLPSLQLYMNSIFAKNVLPRNDNWINHILKQKSKSGASSTIDLQIISLVISYYRLIIVFTISFYSFTKSEKQKELVSPWHQA